MADSIDDPREVPPPEEGSPVSPEEDADADDDEADDEDDDPARWEKEGVFVMRDGKAVFVALTVGIAGEKYFEVEGALEAGDEVVSGPFSAIRNLKDGDAVKVKEEEESDDDESPSA